MVNGKLFATFQQMNPKKMNKLYKTPYIGKNLFFVFLVDYNRNKL